jgi:hypothetical protein
VSTFRITYRQTDEALPEEEIDAVEFLVQEPWIVFLDPSGACLSVRSDQVERVRRVPIRPTSEWTPRLATPLRPPSDPAIPDETGVRSEDMRRRA